MTTRPKLEIEVNKPVQIELLYDECVSGSNSYGAYHLYAVAANGQEYSFFPTENVHEKLKDLRRGDRATITKLAAQRGNKIITAYDVQIDKRIIKPVSAEQSPTELMNNAIPTGDRYYETILESYRDALRIQGELNGLVDVNKIAVTLFIARSKSNGY